jgi:hypothetical protein
MIPLKDKDPAIVGDEMHDVIAQARAENIRERNLADTTNIDLWISEAGLTSPFPDRMIIKEANTWEDLLSVWLDLGSKDEIISGTVIALGENELDLLEILSSKSGVTIGYMINPDVTWDSWNTWTRTKKSIDLMDVPHIFEPIHLPDPDKELSVEKLLPGGPETEDESPDEE